MPAAVTWGTSMPTDSGALHGKPLRRRQAVAAVVLALLLADTAFQPASADDAVAGKAAAAGEAAAVAAGEAAPAGEATPAAAATDVAAAASDGRADTSGLPEGEAPWWPSRYGADDQIGTLNEITAEHVVAAAGLVKTGTVIGLGRILDDKSPAFPGRFWQQTADLTPHVTNLRRSDAFGRGWGRSEINWITEIQSGTFQVGTQLDSIGHIQMGDRFYNGWKVKDVVEAWGLNRFGMETVPPIVSRGLLLDIAAVKNVERLDPGYVITAVDVEAALSRQRVSLGAGDVVLFHTGWGSLWGTDNATFLSGEPGPGLSLIEGLYRMRVAAIGIDTWSIGPVPGEDPERPFLVPQTMYVKMGLFGFENLATENLAGRQVYEFLFVNTHARTRGSTAAIVGPAAVF
jgi:kynurenine formamidase